MSSNVLYFGDNLRIMREYIPDSSVDRMYRDPPFNSKAAAAEFYEIRNHIAGRELRFPRLQLYTVEELLGGDSKIPALYTRIDHQESKTSEKR